MNIQQKKYVFKRIEEIERRKITEASGRESPDDVTLYDLLYKGHATGGKIRLLPADKLRAAIDEELERIVVMAGEHVYHSKYTYTGEGCYINVRVHDIITPGSVGALAMYRKGMAREQDKLDSDRKARVDKIMSRATKIKDELMVGDAEGALAAIADFEKEEF